ncbi:hypothetical protein PVK06_043095 [Gossypium arboreum]|uniref:Uncharacterized protein n=1 Tax=Gossypium arboreum TaxID=29729 RepID=A0ABR0MMT2_GOSAR|nr:hypothetical protein PVK06_043095 [Gossypium arboreum]
MHPEKGFILKESNYKDFMAHIRQVAETLNWELFSEKRPSVDEELVCEFYANLTLSELTEVPVHRIKNYAIRCSGPAYFPFTITILCLKAKILANVKKTGYSQGTITDWDLYRIARDSVLQQRIDESEDPEEEEKDSTEIKLMKSTEVPDKVEPLEPEVEPDDETSMFRA